MRYVDLNSDDVHPYETEEQLHQPERALSPETLYNADLLVSMPKLKTHHWAGVTLSLKTCLASCRDRFTVSRKTLSTGPASMAVSSISTALLLDPRFAIVDGIVGMEGNAPLQGQAKQGGVLIFGPDLVAVDATAAKTHDHRTAPDKIPHARSGIPR